MRASVGEVEEDGDEADHLELREEVDERVPEEVQPGAPGGESAPPPVHNPRCTIESSRAQSRSERARAHRAGEWASGREHGASPRNF